MARERARKTGERLPRIALGKVLSLVTDSFSVFDQAWRITYVNEAALSLSRRAMSEIIGKNVWELYPDLVGSDIERNYRQAMADQQPRTFETYYGPLDLWVEVRAYPSPRQLVVLARDITARKKAELALAESERRYRRIVETAHEGIWLVDAGYHTLWCNTRMAEMLRGTPEQVLGRTVAEFVYEPDRPELRRQMELRRHGQTAQYDIRMQRLDGSMFWALARIAPVMDDSGAFRGALGMITDITERKFVEQELASQREWFRTTLDSIGDAVIATDAGGRITFMNRVAEELTGWPVGDAAGRKLEDVFRIVHETTGDTVESPVQRVLRENRVVGLANHTDLIARDGSRRPIDDSGAPIRGPGGEIVGVVLVFRDNTRRRRTEDALRQADRRKDEFIAMLAHELRNPLAPVASALEIMRLAANDGAAVERSREVIERQLQHMTRLVDDLLDIARITRGRIALQRAVTAVDGVINRAIETVRPLMDRRGQRLRVEMPRHPVRIDADATRLSQVAANLLHNASKFSPDGATIDLTVMREGSDLVIVVRDPGRGIPRELTARLFEPFVQGAPSADRGRAGLGIGLALVKNLVALHGGRVTVHSDGADRGSTFTVRLPIVVEGQPSSLPAPPLAVIPPRRILIVDDNVDAADTLCNLLDILGHKASTAYDAITALEQLRRTRPDLVLLDIGLPRINGYEFAQQLRADPAFAGLKLVAVSGYGQDEDRRKSLEAGFDRHLVKPVDLAALTEALGALFVEKSAAIVTTTLTKVTSAGQSPLPSSPLPSDDTKPPTTH